MKKYIINISREFGCNAREVARELAMKLAIELYDKDLIDLTCQRAGINEDAFNDSDAIVDSSKRNLLQIFSFGSSTEFYSDKAIQAQIEIIKELAQKDGSCIFFGRCADYILREYPNRLNIFLYAPLEKRINHIAKAYELDRATAEKLIKRVDRQRHNYYRYITGMNRGDRDFKQLMIDISEFGIPGTVDIIYDTVQKHFGVESLKN
ncbi:MAG: cytidylate kinase-like family protein [Eubacterium sp.]|nr:cytidylate kinase-like family protein [Eubacterium sp.]